VQLQVHHQFTNIIISLNISEQKCTLNSDDEKSGTIFQGVENVQCIFGPCSWFQVLHSHISTDRQTVGQTNGKTRNNDLCTIANIQSSELATIHTVTSFKMLQKQKRNSTSVNNSKYQQLQLQITWT